MDFVHLNMNCGFIGLQHINIWVAEIFVKNLRCAAILSLSVLELFRNPFRLAFVVTILFTIDFAASENLLETGQVSSL